ncbi:DUF7144 family membrane protein [Streptomyces bambusae]|uniref:DUF7144 domain-containing protein n=1 Tax=Streptomyces bambusae TaxID=1550616 RepID=A0ABS6Z385_9ACTN|nr:hypothetical protein [Streptomyces bambusae]MBW5482197.1 hypothetical protein [Streptomyces bambusae]
MAHTPTTSHGHSDTALAAAGGLVVFAAVMLLIVGVLDIIRGIMGIAQDEVFITTPNYIFQFDVTSWGWLHLIFGIMAAVVGAALFKAPLWGRVAGIVIAAFVILVNFLSLPYYPFWAIIAIAISGFVIWALCIVSPEDMR